MKKVFLALVLVILLSGSALGVSSDDVYVRQDVLNERDRAFMAEIRLGFEQMRREMDKRFSEVDKRFDALDKKIDNVKSELHEEIQKVDAKVEKLDTRVSGLESRMDRMENSFDRSIAILTLVVTAAGFAITFAPFLRSFMRRWWKASIGVKESERLNKKIETLVKQEVERLMKMQLSVK